MLLPRLTILLLSDGLLYLLNLESCEELLFPFKIGAKSRQEETFPKSVWATQQECLVARNEFCEVVRLIYVEVVASAQVFKILKAEGEFPDRFHRDLFSVIRRYGKTADGNRTRLKRASQ